MQKPYQRHARSMVHDCSISRDSKPQRQIVNRFSLVVLAITSATLLVATGCEDTHACLFLVRYQSDKPTTYWCRIVEYKDECPDTEWPNDADSVTVSEFVKDKSCGDLGYSNKCGDEYMAGGCGDGRSQTPGDVVAGGASGGGGGDGDGDGDAACGEYGDRGLDDIQVKSQCQAAWNYTCQGNTQGVQISCANLDGYTQISVDGSNPKDKCPYCDAY